MPKDSPLPGPVAIEDIGSSPSPENATGEVVERRLSRRAAVLGGAGAATLAGQLATAAEPTAERKPWTFPAVPGYGGVVALPDVPQQSDPALRYKVVFSVTQAAREPGGKSPGLDHVARLLNLLALGSVSPAPGDIAAVLYGPATPAALSDGTHRARFGVPNPNAELLHLLRERGVAIEVCGQALAEHGFSPSATAPDVTVVLSGATALANRQLRGWVVLAV